MNNLIIDAANNKILFKIISLDKSYTSDYPNSRENFDKFLIFLTNFLNKNNIEIKDLDNIFINQGPGKFSGIRISMSIVKAFSVTNKLNLYGFNSHHVVGYNYNNIIDLFNKGKLIKNLIKPLYSS